jgi:hypothetical protein
MGRASKKKITPSAKERYLLLERTAEKLGVRIRVEKLTPEEDISRSQGGLIKIGGQWTVIMDKDQPMEVRFKVLVQALAELIDHQTYVPPAVREWLEA